MILYCYISHYKKLAEDFSNISQVMNKLNYNNYIMIYGGKLISDAVSSEKIIHLDCDDSYEGLPNKIHTLAKYIKNNNYTNFTHFCKIDSHTILKKILPLYTNIDYYGYVMSSNDNMPEYRRTYHFNKCSTNSEWNKKKYTGKFVNYCSGGVGYVLSHQSIDYIANCPNNSEYDIYEDLYVGITLYNNKIYPSNLNTMNYIEKW